MTEIEDIDEYLKVLWGNFTLEPTSVIYDGVLYERIESKWSMHWNRRNGWSFEVFKGTKDSP